MSIFPWHRSDDQSLRSRVAELERSLRELAREHEEACARIEEQVELIWLMVPCWLRDEVERAREMGWTVVPSREAIVFHRLRDGEEHGHTVPVPLPDDQEKLVRIRRELIMRIRTFEQAA
jgi:hypothetical protein